MLLFLAREMGIVVDSGTADNEPVIFTLLIGDCDLPVQLLFCISVFIQFVVNSLYEIYIFLFFFLVQNTY